MFWIKLLYVHKEAKKKKTKQPPCVKGDIPLFLVHMHLHTGKQITDTFW